MGGGGMGDPYLQCMYIGGFLLFRAQGELLGDTRIDRQINR